jgi:hypothetical protein
MSHRYFSLSVPPIFAVCSFIQLSPEEQQSKGGNPFSEQCGPEVQSRVAEVIPQQQAPEDADMAEAMADMERRNAPQVNNVPVVFQVLLSVVAAIAGVFVFAKRRAAARREYLEKHPEAAAALEAEKKKKAKKEREQQGGVAVRRK